MSRIIFVNKKENQLVKKWAGGTTTELCIFPFESSYTLRDFTFRISTATIHTEESDFTILPGFTRSLMMLQGGILLKHNTDFPQKMNPFQIATFDGEWNTSSKGIGVDFNVMTSSKATHELSSLILNGTLLFSKQHKNVKEFIGIYCIENCVNVTCDSEEIVLTANDFILLEIQNDNTIEIKTQSPTRLILSKIAI